MSPSRLINLLSLLLLSAILARGQTQAVDAAVDATGQTLNANATTAVLQASLKATTPTISYSGTDASALTVNNTITEAPYYKYKVGASTYNLASAVGFKFDHQYYQDEAALAFTGVAGPVSFSMLWQTTAYFPAGAGANSRIDFVKVHTDSGKDGYDNYAVGGGGTPPSHRSETTLSSASGTGSNVGTYASTTYIVTGVYTPGNPGVFTVRVYDANTYAYIGESTRNSDLATTVSSVVFGSDAGATSRFTGTYSYFKAFVMDLSGKFPLGVPETPGTPTGFSASAASSTSVSLSWSNADTKFQGIQILRAYHGGPFAVVATTSDSATSYTDTGLQPGVQYDYQIRAHNVVYDSSATSTQSATTNTPTTPQRILTRRGA